MGMDSQYDWRVQRPAGKLHLSIGCIRDGDRIFQADLHLERTELTDGQIVRSLLRRPVAAAHMIGSIYYQALRLWMKKCQYYPHPQKLGEQHSKCPRPSPHISEASLLKRK